jgi:hypothetical protein
MADKPSAAPHYMPVAGRTLITPVSQESLQTEEISCKLSEELEPDYDSEILFSSFSPTNLQQMTATLLFPYTTRIVIAPPIYKTKYFIF